MTRALRLGTVLCSALIAAACGGRDSAAHVDPAEATATSDSAPTVPPAADSAALHHALEQVVRGPSAAERAAGAESWFTERTADALNYATVDSTGHVVVDFADLRTMIPNASSSAGSAMLLRELNAAVFAFPRAVSVEYRINGSCDVFGEWLQYGCQVITREEAGVRATAPPGGCHRLEETILAVRPTREGLAARYGRPDSMNAAVEPNRHIPGATDSLFEVYYPGLLVSVRRPPSAADLIHHVAVTDNRYLAWPALGVGARADEVIRQLGTPTTQDATRLVYNCGSETDQPVTFRLSGGVVRAIEIDYYVD